MANPPDNRSGKPAGPPGTAPEQPTPAARPVPRITAQTVSRPPVTLPQVTAPPAGPKLPSITAPQAVPVPQVAPARVPMTAAPGRPVITAPGASPPSRVPVATPAVAPVAPPAVRPPSIPPTPAAGVARAPAAAPGSSPRIPIPVGAPGSAPRAAVPAPAGAPGSSASRPAIPVPAGAPGSSPRIPIPPGAPGSSAPRPGIPAPPGVPSAMARPAVPAPAGAPGATPRPFASPVAPGSSPSRPPGSGSSAVLVPPAPPVAPARPAGAPGFPGGAAPSTMGGGQRAASSPSAIAPPFAASPSAVALSAGPLPEPPSPLPRTGTLEQLTAQQVQALAKIVEAMDSQDYFQVLGLPPNATKGDIKKAFYRDSRTYHPDRVFHINDEAAKQNINSIYKRITEAYYVLRDDVKRAKYLTDINGADRANKLRFTEASEAEQKAEVRKAVEEEYGTVPKARPFFKSALQDIERQNWSSAERNLKMGLTYEPGAARFKEKLVEVQKKLDDERRKSGSAFQIK